MANITLNNELIFNQIVASGSEIICADGGANNYHDFCLKNQTAKKPLAIIGDFDSITPSTLDYFKLQNTPIIKDDDQNHNDFEKAFILILKDIQDSKLDRTRVVCTNGFSRFDHFL